MDSALEMVDRLLFGNNLMQWGIAIGVALVVFTVATLARSIVRSQHKRLAQTDKVELLELPLKVASRTSTLFLIVAALFVGVSLLDTPDKVQTIARTVLTIAVFWQVGIWVATAAISWIERKRKVSMTEDRAAVGTLGIIAVLVRVAIWSVVLLLTLDNLGVDITALVAGLGIGGIAVALALQNVLGDLLASLSITLDKPFVVGDFVIVDDFKGNVEYIGIKSVRLRSLSGEQIVMSNADLLSSRLRNYGRMYERRVVFTLGVTYETPREKVEAIPGMIRDIVSAQKDVRFDRSHFASFGPASLDYEVVYYVLSAEYNRYMDIQQEINFRILEAFEQHGIEFAYPTQKIWLAQVAQAEGVG